MKSAPVIITLHTACLIMIAFSPWRGQNITPAQRDFPAYQSRLTNLSTSIFPAGLSANQPDAGRSLISRLLGAQSEVVQLQESWYWRATVICIRFLIAALLAAGLAMRPRKNTPNVQRNLFVAQTQILVAVVGAAMMMIVADSVARAFGIFAAASLVRFRTNIRDPKEITVLLICLAIGLSSGIGQLEISLVLMIFSFLLLWLLERFESGRLMRMMELTVKSSEVETTSEMLKDIFKQHHLTAELRRIDLDDKKNSTGKILYKVTIPPTIGIDQLTDEIFSAGAESVKGVEWEQRRGGLYLYR